MFGPAMITTWREITKNCKLGKYKLRKGDVIFAPCSLKHRDSNLFEEANKFKVDRFTSENSHKFNNADYSPFSLGKRNCVG